MKIEKHQDVCQEAVYTGLFRTIAPVLRNFLLYKFQQINSAEDAVQEAFSVLWKNCKNVTSELAQAYLFRVAQNQILSQLEKNKVHQKYMGLQVRDDHETAPDFQLEYKELSHQLKDAIEDLPDGQRETFLLNRMDGKKYAEIAEMQGVSVKAVEKRMHKALVKLRQVCKKI